jgi:predicted amidohydrolase
MKIALLQTDIIWEDKAANLEKLERLIETVPKNTDIVVLPEMFNTGFSMDPERLSEEPEGITSHWMGKMAEKGNFGLCGSYIVRENDHFLNRFLFVSPDNPREAWHYDKRHLFSMAGEHRHFHPGKEKVIFTFREIRICPLVCYDLRFPVWSRNRNEYDLLIYSANWPEQRKLAWNTLIRARAIENQCFVAAVNRTGADGTGAKYCGESAVIDYIGETLVSAGITGDSVVSYDIPMAKLQEFRKKFPFLDDGDDFVVKI